MKKSAFPRAGVRERPSSSPSPSQWTGCMWSGGDPRGTKGLPPWPPCGSLHPPRGKASLPASKKLFSGCTNSKGLVPPPSAWPGFHSGPVCHLAGGRPPRQGGSRLGAGPSLVLTDFSLQSRGCSANVSTVGSWCGLPTLQPPPKKGSQNHRARTPFPLHVSDFPVLTFTHRDLPTRTELLSPISST